MGLKELYKKEIEERLDKFLGRGKKTGIVYRAVARSFLKDEKYPQAIACTIMSLEIDPRWQI